MATTIKVDGVVVALPAFDAWPGRLTLRRSGISTLSLTRTGVLPTPDDPKLDVEIQVLYDGVPIFTGDVVDQQANWTNMGWVTTYQARCLRNRGDRLPFIDANTKTTTAVYNLPKDDPLSFASRTGRTIGEVILDCLTMPENAEGLHALGIGGYTSLSPPTLPPVTVADLEALDKIPPQFLAVSGGKLLSAIESFVQSATANVDMWVRPDGVIRFLDLRDAVERTLTLGDCESRAQLVSVTRSVADCWSAVKVLGEPLALPKWLALSNGGLEKYWAWGDYDVAEAEAAWTRDDFFRGGASRAQGACSVTDTLHVVVDPADDAQRWDANAFAQDEWAGQVNLTVAVVSGVESVVSRRVVANTALTPGGTCTLTLDEPLPAIDYTRFALYGQNAGQALVHRRYRVVDPDMREALARKFSAQAVWINNDGNAATATSFPMASICWSTNGSPPYDESTDDFTFDIEEGTITFVKPTFLTAGGREPDDVRFLAAVNEGVLSARAPASGHEGQAHDDLGVEREMVHYMRTWTDPGNQAAQEAYAAELLDSVKDTAVDVSVDVHKFWAPALDFANGLSVAGTGFSTHIEDANLPIREVTLSWNVGSGSHHTMNVSASNRRTAVQPDNLLPPERPRNGGFAWGSEGSAVSAETLPRRGAI